MWLNIIMMLISAIMRYFVMFPEKAKEIADIITSIILFVMSRFG